MILTREIGAGGEVERLGIEIAKVTSCKEKLGSVVDFGFLSMGRPFMYCVCAPYNDPVLH